MTNMKNKPPLPGQTPLDFTQPTAAPSPPPPPPIATPVFGVQQVLAARPIKPRRKRGVPGPADVESAARDEALDALEAARAALVAEAHKIAVQLARQRGRVTSVEVWHAMIAFGYEDQLKGYDPRWMGCIFRAGKGWERAGWESTGSHKRPVAIWRLA